MTADSADESAENSRGPFGASVFFLAALPTYIRRPESADIVATYSPKGHGAS
jgi:hypothetical protein